MGRRATCYDNAAMEDMEIQKKLGVLVLADQIGNVSEASRISAISRDTIYRHRRLIKQNGNAALKRQATQDLRHKTVPMKRLKSWSSTSRYKIRTSA